MTYVVYWLISEDKNKTYIGFSDNPQRRFREHRQGVTKATKDFGNFKAVVLENKIPDSLVARKREKYWKSCAGRRKLKRYFESFDK